MPPFRGQETYPFLSPILRAPNLKRSVEHVLQIAKQRRYGSDTLADTQNDVWEDSRDNGETPPAASARNGRLVYVPPLLNILDLRPMGSVLAYRIEATAIPVRIRRYGSTLLLRLAIA